MLQDGENELAIYSGSHRGTVLRVVAVRFETKDLSSLAEFRGWIEVS